MQEYIEEQETWDKKKIIVFLITAIVLVISGFYVKTKYFGDLQKQSIVPSKTSQEVAGESIEGNDSKDSTTNSKESFSSIPSSIKNNVQDKLDLIKQQITNLNAVDIATSSPQVQKILNDIKALEQYPSNQAKEMCQKICSSL